jgi:hypothetical protein
VAENPYTPPAAEVADFAPPAARIRPRNVNIALWLIGADLVIQVLAQLRAMVDGHFHIEKPLVFALTIVEYVLILLLMHQLAQGRSWPRVVLLMLTLTGFAVLCYFVGGAFRYLPDELELLYSPGFLLNRVLPIVIYFVALHLLYFASGDWFSEKQK